MPAIEVRFWEKVRPPQRIFPSLYIYSMGGLWGGDCLEFCIFTPTPLPLPPSWYQVPAVRAILQHCRVSLRRLEIQRIWLLVDFNPKWESFWKGPRIFSCCFIYLLLQVRGTFHTERRKTKRGKAMLGKWGGGVILAQWDDSKRVRASSLFRNRQY